MICVFESFHGGGEVGGFSEQSKDLGSLCICTQPMHNGPIDHNRSQGGCEGQLGTLS